jgi:hypothetical protein
MSHRPRGTNSPAKSNPGAVHGKGSNAPVRSAESASGSTTRASCQSSNCPEMGPCPASAALTTEPQPVHRLRIASLLRPSAASASVCCATAAPRPSPPGASAPETLRLSRGLPCSSAACRGRALTPTSTHGTSSLRRRWWRSSFQVRMLSKSAGGAMALDASVTAPNRAREHTAHVDLCVPLRSERRQLGEVMAACPTSRCPSSSCTTRRSGCSRSSAATGHSLSRPS